MVKRYAHLTVESKASSLTVSWEKSNESHID
jgi:hypothetical protein